MPCPAALSVHQERTPEVIRLIRRPTPWSMMACLVYLKVIDLWESCYGSPMNRMGERVAGHVFYYWCLVLICMYRILEAASWLWHSLHISLHSVQTPIKVHYHVFTLTFLHHSTCVISQTPKRQNASSYWTRLRPARVSCIASSCLHDGRAPLSNVMLFLMILNGQKGAIADWSWRKQPCCPAFVNTTRTYSPNGDLIRQLSLKMSNSTVFPITIW